MAVQRGQQFSIDPNSKQMDDIVEAIRNRPPFEFNPAPFSSKKSERYRRGPATGRWADTSGFHIEDFSGYVEGQGKVVARNENKDILGSLTWSSNPDSKENRGEIQNVNVDPKYQGLGIATNLLQHATKLSEAQGLAKPMHSPTRSAQGLDWSKTTPEHEPESTRWLQTPPKEYGLDG